MLMKQLLVSGQITVSGFHSSRESLNSGPEQYVILSHFYGSMLQIRPKLRNFRAH